MGHHDEIDGVEPNAGEVSERFKELVLKTSDSERGRGFESHPLRHVRYMSSFAEQGMGNLV
jgi:hypothetical protein